MPRHGEISERTAAGGPVPPRSVARWCAAQGWPVHPLAPGRKTPAANCPECRSRRHTPAACPCLPAGRPCHGFHAATTDTARIDAWWTATPSAGVGVACGPAGLVVIDIDAHAAEVPDRGRLLPGIPIPEQVSLDGLASGFDTLALLAAYRGRPDPAADEDTLRVRTPSGGLHVWYRNPDPATRLRCSTGSGSRAALAWQVDVRADGGYIVAPTTRTAQGVYRPLGSTRTPAPLPGWLHDELVRTGHLIAQTPTENPEVAPHAGARRAPDGTAPAPSPRPDHVPTARPNQVPTARRAPRTGAAHRILDPLIAQVARCAEAREGTAFTEKLNRAAYTAGGLIAAGHLDHSVVRDRLVRVAQHARPWQQARNEAIVDDALAVGSARPLHLEGRS
ncbi:bifunctional DNA primase/polymerase [Streptomyces similanensis]|uniref:DNA primase/polymerase bifunctional N-terminal domain-containing protein n=1 Tax=Streptomyces similanensis TaxID=1274988 RepID=A0ABP9JUA7_9ACTN